MSGPVASIGVAVVPDATNFWRIFEAKTLPQAEKTGEKEGREFMRGFKAATAAENADVNINVKTAKAVAELEKLRAEIALLNDTKIDVVTDRNRKSLEQLGQAATTSARDVERGAQRTNRSGRQYESFFKKIARWVAILGPGLIPIGAALVGGLLEIGPIAATAALGITGLIKQYKAGAFAGTEFADDIKLIRNEYRKLQQISSVPLAEGIHAGLAAIKPLLPVVNDEFRIFGKQLGAFVAAAGPGIVSLLLKLEPLFLQFGNALVTGAQHFDHWAKSSGSMQDFIAYVRDTLPDVIHTLGNLAGALGHLLRAMAPYGSIVLHTLDLLASALDSIPLDVLGPLASGALQVYAAFRLWKLFSGVLTSFNRNLAKSGTAFTGWTTKLSNSMDVARAKSDASLASMEANQAAYRASVVSSQAATADASLASASTQVKAAEQAGGAKLLQAQQTEEAALAISVAWDSEAAAAQAASLRAIAAAEAQAAAVVVAEEAATISLGSVLGPMALVAAGIALVATSFGDNQQQAQNAAAAMNDYTESVKKSIDMTNEYNAAQTRKALADKGAFQLLDGLQKAGHALGYTYDDLTTSVGGSAKGFAALVGRLNDMGPAGELLAKVLGSQRAGLQTAVGHEKEYQKALQQSKTALDQASLSTRTHATALGLSVPAYEKAAAAAKKAAQSQRDQTAAMQQSSDVAGLLTQALDGLAGAQLRLSASSDSVITSEKELIKGMKKGKNEIEGNSKAALDNRAHIRDVASATQAYAEELGKQTHSGKLAVSTYKEMKNGLIDQLKAQGDLTPKMRDYINQMFDVRDVQDYINQHPVKFDADTTTATKKAHALQQLIRDIRQDRVPGIDVDTRQGRAYVAELQRQIDLLHGKQVTIQVDRHTTLYETPGGGGRQTTHHGKSSGTITYGATGGLLSGPGTGTSDSIPLWGSNGEFMVNARATSQHLALLTAINNGMKGYAKGGRITDFGTGDDSPIIVKGKGKNKQFIFDQAYYSKRAQAEHAVTKQIVQLEFQINHNSLRQFRKSWDKTVGEMQQAYRSFYLNAVKLAHDKGSDYTKDSIKLIKQEEHELTKLMRARDKSDKQLKEAKDHLHDLTKARRALSRSVVDSVANAQDISGMGTAAGQARPTFGSIKAEQTQNFNITKKFVAGLKTLIKEGLDPTQVQQLAAAGISAYPQVQALVAAKPGQIRALAKQFRRIQGLAGGLGSKVGGQEFGHRIDVATGLITGKEPKGVSNKDERKLAEKLFGKNSPGNKILENGLKHYADHNEKAVRDMGHTIARQLHRSVTAVANRPIVLKSDDRILARSGDHGKKKNGRRT